MDSRCSDGIDWVSDLAAEYERFPPMRFGDPNTPRPTWKQLVVAEPRLAELMATARGYHPTREGFCANEVWYGPAGLRRKMIRLVGWRAEGDDPILHGSVPYEAAYDTLYQALPDCVHGDDGCRRGVR